LRSTAVAALPKVVDPDRRRGLTVRLRLPLRHRSEEERCRDKKRQSTPPHHRPSLVTRYQNRIGSMSSSFSFSSKLAFWNAASASMYSWYFSAASGAPFASAVSQSFRLASASARAGSQTFSVNLFASRRARWPKEFSGETGWTKLRYTRPE